MKKLIHNFRNTLVGILVIIVLSGCENKMMNILVFIKANGYIHESAEIGAKVIKELEKSQPYSVQISDDSLVFRESKLRNFDVIIFLSTSGDILDEEGKAALKSFINSGGGFVGIHGATTTEKNWSWYGKLIGTYFTDHPKIQEATLNTLVNDVPSTRHLSEKWIWSDEWYNWSHPLGGNFEVLVTVDESTYEGGNHPEFHPISWRQEFDGGRIWYTALGHKSESYKDEKFLKHIIGGIEWVSGD